MANVDEGAYLIALHRMDNAQKADIEMSQGKAWTSVSFTVKIFHLPIPYFYPK